ncbi:hypothetical protein ABPG75_003884 [Micractinium tetrahymenae]
MEPQLRVLAHGAGSIEWRVESPTITPRSALQDLLRALLLTAVPAALLGAGWRRSLLLALAAACALAAGRAMLAVQCESLTYVRLLGVRLASRRRSGLWSSAQFIPLRQLQGIIIHEEVTATSVHFWLGLMLKKAAADGQAGSGASDGEAARHPLSSSGGGRRLIADGGEVEVAFPRLRPRLDLLRQVYQQLHPLLTTDLEAVAGDASQAGSGQQAGQQQAAAAAGQQQGT